MPAIGLIDVSGIQNAIFRSGKLKEIAATSEAIESLSMKNGLFEKEAGALLLVAAGGNLAMIAQSEEEIKKVVRNISSELLRNYPGLDAVAAVCHYNKGELADGFRNAQRQLERNKLTQPRSCRFEFPGFNSDEQQTIAKIDCSNEIIKGESDLDRIVCNIFRNGKDALETKEKSDLIAIVSIDGLGMGRRIIQWMQEMKGENDDTFIEQYKIWSESIRERWQTSWNESAELVRRQFNADGKWQHSHQARYLCNQGKDPFRHIYQGGDDLSFVCDAHIALSLTSEIITRLEQPREDVHPLFQSITASAGILLVDKQYPFGRAVQMAEAVRKSAKKLSAEHSHEGKPSPSVVSWWLNRQGEMEMPERLFKGASQKPYLLHAQEQDEPTIESFTQKALPALWNAFKDSRSLFKNVLEAACEGQEGVSVKRVLGLRSRSSGVTDEKPFSGLPEPFNTESGFDSGGRGTVLLDAGELFDLYFPFQKGE